VADTLSSIRLRARSVAATLPEPLSSGIAACSLALQRVIWRAGRRRKIQAYVQAHSVRKLQIGSGRNILADWLNTDLFAEPESVVFVDVRTKLPFHGRTFDYIFSEHVIEHVSYPEAFRMLTECYRVLKPDGKIRIATPDLAKILNIYNSPDAKLHQEYIAWWTNRFEPDLHNPEVSVVVNGLFHKFGHMFLFDRTTLQNAMQQVGFVDIAECVPGQSPDPVLQALERHGEMLGHEEFNKLETMVLEARRPGSG
jgi:predicted SAM-dependent methyltransferase